MRTLGVTAIYVTHDQTEALMLSDRVAVMRGGRIEQVGTPDAVYLRPQTPFVAQFLGTVAFVSCRRDGRGELQPSPPETADLVVSLRPEQVALCAAQDRDPWAAAVEDVHFLGHVYRVSLRLEDGQSIIADVSVREWEALAEVRDRLAMRVDIAAAATLPRAAPTRSAA